MSRFRAAIRQSPAIVISLVALTFSLGSGAGYAASTVTSHPSAPAKVATWHKLTLINGWKALPRGDGYRAPSYAVIGNVVYLTGAMYQPVAGSDYAFRLPKSVRPAHKIAFGVYAGAADFPSDLYLYHNGTGYFTGPNASNESSLGGVSYPLGS
jgi:hypothetical protein